VGKYRTRDHRAAYHVRHGTRDVGIFSEIFIAGEYEPPSAVLAVLGSAGDAVRVLDLGANVGLFAAFCRWRWPNASIVALEPDPDNFAVLRQTAAANAGIACVHGCAGPHAGSVRFVAGHFAESYVAVDDADPSAIDVPCLDAFELAASVDLVKIDIEGSEWDLLRDPRLRTLSAASIVMEWHDKRCPFPDPGTAARKALERAGYTVVATHQPVPTNGTIWAVRHAP
jgi:FkbM family methyltransferase